MKKVMINTRVLAIALIAVLTMTIITPAMANDDKKAIPVEMKFIGNMKNQPVFAMTFTNTEETEFTITVRDSYSNVLYKADVKGSNITKNFRLNTEELGDIPLTFEVSGGKTHKTVVFEINKYSRMVEDVVVTKIK
jgi:hypothetical protein